MGAISKWETHVDQQISSGDIPTACGALFSAALAEPRGTLLEPWWNPGKNPRGTLVEPYLRAAPDHPGAYLGLSTPKLSAVGGKNNLERNLLGRNPKVEPQKWNPTHNVSFQRNRPFAAGRLFMPENQCRGSNKKGLRPSIKGEGESSQRAESFLRCTSIRGQQEQEAESLASPSTRPPCAFSQALMAAL